MTAIPGGTHTYSKLNFPGPRRRALWGEGCMLRCDDGRTYVDTVAALCAVSLGYNDPDVDDAIQRQLGCGVNFSVPSVFEEEVAQHFLRFLDWGERVRFSKNGADVTNLAVRLARAHTQRDVIVTLDYCGHDDWYQALHACAGIPPLFRSSVVSSLPPVATSVAAVILEPIPSDGSDGSASRLRRIGHWARKHGALLIYDCIITGMRLNRRGWPDDAPEPDLACYGKAMGNGMPLSACVGPAELMDRITKDVFFSTTFGGECLSLAAADAVLTAYETRDVLQRLEEAGNRLNDSLLRKASTHGLNGELEIVSYPARPFHKWRAVEQAETFTRVILEQGILYQGYHNLMLATCEDDPLTQIERAYDVALEAVAKS